MIIVISFIYLFVARFNLFTKINCESYERA